MIGVEQHAEPPRANPRHVDDVFDKRQMGGDRVVEPFGETGACVRSRDFARQFAIAIEHALTDQVGHDAPIGPEQFHSVVFGRIVAGGDLDSAGTAVLPHQHAGGRRGGNAAVENGSRTAACQSGDHGLAGVAARWPARRA